MSFDVSAVARVSVSGTSELSHFEFRLKVEDLLIPLLVYLGMSCTVILDSWHRLAGEWLAMLHICHCRVVGAGFCCGRVGLWI